MDLMLKIYKLSEKMKRLALSVWLSYLAGISIEFISNSSSFSELLHNVFDLSKISALILWISAFIVAFLWSFNYVFDKIRINKKVEAQFTKIMKEHTYEILNMSELTSYSWGYNKALCVPTNPGGWKPTDIYIDLKNSIIESDYSFDDNWNQMQFYDNMSYSEYCENSSKIQIIKQRNSDYDHYGVCHFEKNFKTNKVELRLQRNTWSQLQFSWDYLRRFSNDINFVINSNETEKINRTFISALNHDKNFLINSFCLHLVLVSKTGKAILSKISKIKSNDYPSSWAATLGEQLERNDFLNDFNGELYPDFVVRWVKRALKEELGIDESVITEKGISELDEYTDMSSLRVLSLDFEGDIYNVALVCVLKLNIDAKQLESLKGIKLDDNEVTNEFIECSESEIRKILLNYPENQKDYHPSTYLRLLMFLLYSCKQSATMSAIVKDSKRIRKKLNQQNIIKHSKSI